MFAKEAIFLLISKLRVTGLCEGKSPVTGEFPTQMASNAENVSIWWRPHEKLFKYFSTIDKGLFIGNILADYDTAMQWVTGMCCGPFLLTWCNFNPNMDEWSHAE